MAAVDDSFCDVGTLLANLGSGEGEEAAADAKEQFESFDDLIAEANADSDGILAGAESDETSVDNEPEPESEPEPAAKKKVRGKKKISFM